MKLVELFEPRLPIPPKFARATFNWRAQQEAVYELTWLTEGVAPEWQSYINDYWREQYETQYPGGSFVTVRRLERAVFGLPFRHQGKVQHRTPRWYITEYVGYVTATGKLMQVGADYATMAFAARGGRLLFAMWVPGPGMMTVEDDDALRGMGVKRLVAAQKMIARMRELVAAQGVRLNPRRSR